MGGTARADPKQPEGAVSAGRHLLRSSPTASPTSPTICTLCHHGLCALGPETGTVGVLFPVRVRRVGA